MRHARADRIMRVLAAMDYAGATALRDTTYGLLSAASVELAVSKATVSRDFALVRRIHRQFGRMFGRNFDPKSDKIFWHWDWSYYGFMTPESTKAGFPDSCNRYGLVMPLRTGGSVGSMGLLGKSSNLT